MVVADPSVVGGRLKTFRLLSLGSTLMCLTATCDAMLVQPPMMYVRFRYKWMWGNEEYSGRKKKSRGFESRAWWRWRGSEKNLVLDETREDSEKKRDMKQQQQHKQSPSKRKGARG